MPQRTKTRAPHPTAGLRMPAVATAQIAATSNVPEEQVSAAGPSTRRTLLVPENMDGSRLDRCLAAVHQELTRTRLQHLIRSGYVKIDDVMCTDPGQRIRSGQHIAVDVPEPEAAEPAPEDIPLAVVYEDAHLIVIDKPAGLVVHPGAGHGSGTLVNALIAHCGASLSGIGGVKRPGIVHRLDKDTSGLLVVAKTDAAHQGLSAQFAAHGSDGRLQRTYLALVWGVPGRPVGVVDLPLKRDAANRLKFSPARTGSGRHAVTHYRVAETYSGPDGGTVASLLAITLETGRTHQIRVHMASIGHPLLGDAVYGKGFRTRAARLSAPAQGALEALGRQALHAAELGFEHPANGRKLFFTSKIPADFHRLLAALQAGSKKPDSAVSDASKGIRRNQRKSERS